ncbi:ribonuclease T2 family protein [Notoacmeibacter ruber]|uniref:Ribonuclease n=1 Tax=Notoacmeibacter ruber TaxID=2670375 RepID=A0A3L7JDJ9_9HYPH|nr:ribonuclease T2 [Notoacmeibacter ruber]RLQ87661.1 ribonuclease [Notoacmeibacter ruber]
MRWPGKAIPVLLVIAGLAIAGLLPLDGLSPWNTAISETSGERSSTAAENRQQNADMRSSPVGGDLPRPSGNFDFWLLALSWSPSYCAAEGANASRRQCGRDGPSGFVVHGLWPQYEGGGFPSDCPSSEPGRISQQTYARISDLIPTIGLAGHQWRKHGACSGLSQADYFRTTRAAFRKLRLPKNLAGGAVSPANAEEAFVQLNPGLRPDSLAVTCDRRFLREVRICLDKDLNFIKCPAVDRRGCRMTAPLMPNKN